MSSGLSSGQLFLLLVFILMSHNAAMIHFSKDVQTKAGKRRLSMGAQNRVVSGSRKHQVFG